MHIRDLREVIRAYNDKSSFISFPHGLMQSRWGYADARLADTGYQEYVGSVFADTLELACRAVATVFDLKSRLEFDISDSGRIIGAFRSLVMEEKVFDAWTVVITNRKIVLAFSQPKDAVEFELCLPYPEA